MRGRSGWAYLLGCVGLMFAVLPVQGQNSASPAAARQFHFVYRVEVPAVAGAREALRVWLPVPSSDVHQRIAHVRIHGPVVHRLVSDKTYGNRIAYFEIPPARLARPSVIVLEFDATRYSYRIDLADPAAGLTLSPDERQRYLRPDRLVPTSGIIAELSQQQTAGARTPLEKARAVYEYVIRTMRYDHEGTGWGRGDAIYACTARHGNCTDFHSLFIALVRAAGVPARFEIGFPLPADQKAGEIPGYHCWAEFWLDGVGWVPVDASEAWKNPALHDFFFGGLDANRVRFTYGRDLELVPPQQGEPVNYLIYPYAELGGKPFTGLRWSFRFADRGRPVAETGSSEVRDGRRTGARGER